MIGITTWRLLAMAMFLGRGLSTIYDVPNVLYSGPSTAQSISGFSGFDGQKVTPWPNASSYDWWYFDAVSTSSANESLTVVFVQTTPKAFDLVTGDSLLSIVFQGSFADGSLFGFQIDASPTSGHATIETHGDGASGNWHTTGFTFTGTDNLSQYTIQGNNSAYNVSGSMILDSVAPAHLPCGPNRPGSSEQLLPSLPTVYWANAIPDSIATINFVVNGRKLSFVGAGYHDKNWGIAPFRDAIRSQYWGHARLGPYSLLWLDVITTSGEEHVSAYVARNGRIVLGSCQAGSVKVRPYGKNSDYPPTPQSGVPEGLRVDFDLGAGQRLVADITTKVVVIPSDNFIYGRYVGPISGGIVGGEQYKGNAIWEQFKYAAKA